MTGVTALSLASDGTFCGELLPEVALPPNRETWSSHTAPEPARILRVSQANKRGRVPPFPPKRSDIQRNRKTGRFRTVLSKAGRRGRREHRIALRSPRLGGRAPLASLAGLWEGRPCPDRSGGIGHRPRNRCWPNNVGHTLRILRCSPGDHRRRCCSSDHRCNGPPSRVPTPVHQPPPPR